MNADPDAADPTSQEYLADYECPECGPMTELAENFLLTEDQALVVIAGDADGNMRCPNDWCDNELDLTADAAAANRAWLIQQRPDLTTAASDTDIQRD